MVLMRNTKHPRVLMMMTTNQRSLDDTARCREALMTTMGDRRSSDEHCQVQRSLRHMADGAGRPWTHCPRSLTHKPSPTKPCPQSLGCAAGPGRSLGGEDHPSHHPPQAHPRTSYVLLLHRAVCKDTIFKQHQFRSFSKLTSKTVNHVWDGLGERWRELVASSAGW